MAGAHRSPRVGRSLLREWWCISLHPINRCAGTATYVPHLFALGSMINTRHRREEVMKAIGYWEYFPSYLPYLCATSLTDLSSNLQHPLRRLFHTYLHVHPEERVWWQETVTDTCDDSIFSMIILTKTFIQIIGVVIGTIQGIVTQPLEILQVYLSDNLIISKTSCR